MAYDNEKLYVVTRAKVERYADGSVFQFGDSAPFKLFRTRAGARKYAKDMQARSKNLSYKVEAVSWGPEQ